MSALFLLPENREENVYGRVHYECEQCRQWIRMGCPHAGTAGRYRYPDDDPDEIFQLSHLGHWFKNTVGGIFHDKHVTKHTEAGDQSISQFQSLCTALAATIGTGNIVGVASALVAGGPGAIFWMWVVAFFGMMTNYSEMFWVSTTAAGTPKGNGVEVPCTT